MPSVDLPGRPTPLRPGVRALPVLNPLAIAVAGLVYGLLLAVVLSLWVGLGAFVNVPSPSLSLQTALAVWLAGCGLAVVRDAARKVQTSVTITPGWITRAHGAASVTVPRDEVTNVRIRASLVDRLAGTATVDIYDADGHRLRLPRVRDRDAVEQALSGDRSDERHDDGVVGGRET